MKKHLATIFVAAFFGMFAAALTQTAFMSARAVQNEIIPPTSGIYTGPQFSQLIGDGLRSVVSCNKGSSAPATVGASAVDGLCWLDDTTSKWLMKRYINGNWANEGAYNSTNGTYIGLLGGGTATLSSASTTDLGSVPEANISITGTTTINGFGSSAPTGSIKIIRFASELTLTYSSALPVPTGGYNLTTAANDRAIVTHLGSGNWEITQYTRANGIPIDPSKLGEPRFSFAATVPTFHVRGTGQALTRTSYPAYTAAVTRAQNGTRTSGNATITGVADTTGFGVGMPVESTGVNAGCTIASFVANTSVTLNSSSCVTASGTSTMTVFLTGYGSGGTSSTVGVPDCTGRSLAGRETTATRLTSTYFGGNSTAFMASGGAESQTLTLAQLPTGITSSGTNSITVNPAGSALNQVPYAAGTWANLSAGAGANNVPQSNANGSIFSTNSFTGSNSISVTSNNTSGNAHTIVPPTLIADCVVRVIP